MKSQSPFLTNLNLSNCCKMTSQLWRVPIKGRKFRAQTLFTPTIKPTHAFLFRFSLLSKYSKCKVQLLKKFLKSTTARNRLIFWNCPFIRSQIKNFWMKFKEILMVCYLGKFTYHPTYNKNDQIRRFKKRSNSLIMFRCRLYTFT